MLTLQADAGRVTLEKEYKDMGDDGFKATAGAMDNKVASEDGESSEATADGSATHRVFTEVTSPSGNKQPGRGR